MSRVCPRPLLALLIFANMASAADWPAWRYDSKRSASTDHVLSEQLYLQWSRQLPALTPAWNEDPRLKFDANYQPIVKGKTMYVSSSQNDSLTAIDVDTGHDRWKFYADGPIRFAPVAWQQWVIFGSDDGHCYCLEANTGKVVWKFNGAPSGRLAIGNERMISVWPVRTGPVIADDGQLYFTVGVWPFEGTLLYCLDPATGQQKHVADLRDQAPQGYLVSAEDKLYVPCGRSTAYGVQLGSYERLPLKYQARGTSDYHLTCNLEHLFHGGKIINTATSKSLQLDAHRPVTDDGKIYFVNEGLVHAYDLEDQTEVEVTNRRGEKVLTRVPRLLWKLDGIPAATVHMRAGNRLYAHHQRMLFAIELPETADAKPQVSWRAEIDGEAASMLAADNKLCVVTKQGVVHCFQGVAREAKTIAPSPIAMPVVASTGAAQAHSSNASMRDGYCLVLGIGDGQLIDELVQETPFRVIVIDPNESNVSELRKRMDRHGKYGTRVVAKTAHLESLQLPPYMASLLTSGDITNSGLGAPESFVRQIFHALRPYGGAASFHATDTQHEAIRAAVEASDLPNAILRRDGGITSLVRSGALPGSGDWTHEFGDPANTLMSHDKLVKAPLGVLWFGGPSADGRLYYDRHDWAPSMAVIDGRMFIQGPRSFAAVDVYTGRILWQKELPDGKSPGRRANWDASGYHYIADKDAIYLTFPDKCLRLSPDSGDLLNELRLPDEASRWGRIRLWKDLLIVPAFVQLEDDSARPLTIYVLDKRTGAEVWSLRSKLGFPLIAIGNDIVYCYEGKLSGLYRGDSEKRRGGVPVRQSDELAVQALRVSTGEELWTKPYDDPVSWLSFSEQEDVVMVSNRNGMEAVDGTSGQSLWSKQSTGQGFKGHPENYWDRLIIWKDQLLDQRGPGLAYQLRTGENVVQTNPLTGQEVDWQFTKVGHHCNYAIASEFLMTFRADTAGFCDIATGETARLNGFRSGCRNSLIPANGVLNAPNYGHGCVCSYSVFTSLALVHVPESEAWTYSTYELDQGPIKQLGLNLGAPGDRRAENGTLWLDYPSVGGPSPKVNVSLVGETETFRRHPATVSGDGPSWVSASGVTGLESLTVALAPRDLPNDAAEKTCTVRLVFSEPAEVSPDARVFDVAIQGTPVITALDVRKEAGASQRTLVKTIKGVKFRDELTITLAAHKSQPLLCGVEVVVDD